MTSKILIVEDEALLALDLKNQLENQRYEVTAIAPSNKKAMKLIAETVPDLVLMDIQIKGKIDGVETAKMVKEQYNIPVVFLTAYADDTFLQRAKLAEPFGYLLKPIDTRDLHSTIEMALYKAGMEQERLRLTQELEKALAEVKTLRGILPICASCKKIRDSKGYWKQVEEYICQHSEAKFSHSLCHSCAEKMYHNEEWFQEYKKKC